MQLTERIKNCNGCGACVVACKYVCVKMEEADGLLRPYINENGCSKCNACMLYCPLYNTVELPDFEEFFEAAENVRNRDMAPVYRATMRSVKEGRHTEFVGTLCQIAALMLDREQRKAELARITGGSHVTEALLASAGELLDQADRYRSELGMRNHAE